MVCLAFTIVSLLVLDRLSLRLNSLLVDDVVIRLARPGDIFSGVLADLDSELAEDTDDIGEVEEDVGKLCVSTEIGFTLLLIGVLALFSFFGLSSVSEFVASSMRLFRFDNLALNEIKEYYFRIEINRKVILIYSLSKPKLALTFIYYKLKKKTCRRYLII